MQLILSIASSITDTCHQCIACTCHLRSRRHFPSHCQEVALFALCPLSSLFLTTAMTARVICKCSSSSFSLVKAHIPPFPALISITNFDQPIKFQYNFVLVSVSLGNCLGPICKPNLLFPGHKHQALHKAFPNCSILCNGKDSTIYLKVLLDY